jgi:molybdate transport system substrate-binding protein
VARTSLMWNVRNFILTALVLLITLVAAVEVEAQSAPSRELTISAAISLKNAFEDMAKEFAAKKPGVKVLFNFGGSGDLARQIEAGAPVDVFASAARKDMDDVDQKGLLAAGSRRDFTRNSLVLVRPAIGSVKLMSVNDLAKSDVKRIAVGNPKSVPAGRYAEEALRNLKLWDGLKEKLIFGENVRQVLDYVARGEVDAGLVYSTDAAIRGKEVEIVARLPEGSHQPVVYPIAVIKGSRQEPLAKAFVEEVISAEGQRILGRYGFVAIEHTK